MTDDLHEYVSPAPKRTFPIVATVRMAGRLGPLPYDLETSADMNDTTPPPTLCCLAHHREVACPRCACGAVDDDTGAEAARREQAAQLSARWARWKAAAMRRDGV